MLKQLMTKIEALESQAHLQDRWRSDGSMVNSPDRRNSISSRGGFNSRGGFGGRGGFSRGGYQRRDDRREYQQRERYNRSPPSRRQDYDARRTREYDRRQSPDQGSRQSRSFQNDDARRESSSNYERKSEGPPALPIANPVVSAPTPIAVTQSGYCKFAECLSPSCTLKHFEGQWKPDMGRPGCLQKWTAAKHSTTLSCAVLEGVEGSTGRAITRRRCVKKLGLTFVKHFIRQLDAKRATSKREGTSLVP